MQELQLHVEVALQQALEAAAMTGLVLCHLMDGIVDRIQVQGLCLLGQVHLAGAGTALGLGTHCLLYTSPSPRDRQKERMPSSA